MKNIEVVLDVKELRGKLDIPVLDNGNAIASKLERLNGSHRLNIGAIAGLDDYAKVRKSAMKNKTVQNIYTGGSGFGTFVPYTGATANVDLGANNFIVNTNQLYINTVSGNVGIGTTNPTHKLDVVGNISIPNDNYYRVVDIGGTSRSYAGINTSNILGLGAQGGSIPLTLHGGNSTAFIRLNTNGNVGIGTTNPTQKLEVNGGTDAKILCVGSTGSAIHLKTTSNSAWSEWQQTTASTRLNASDGTTILTDIITALNTGNVGIGDATPSTKLSVNGTTQFLGNSYIKGTQYIDSNNFGGVATVSLAVGDTDTGLHSTGDGQLNLYSNSVNTVSVRSGNTGFGTTNPNSVVEVNGGVRLNTSLAQPAASAATVGMLWVIVGISGQLGSLQVCLKSATDTYSWKIIMTG